MLSPFFFFFFSRRSMQSYSKESVAHVQKYLTKNEVPTHLFEVRISHSSPEKRVFCVSLCFVAEIDNRPFPHPYLLSALVMLLTALHRRDLHPLTGRHLSKVCRKRQVHPLLSVEESRTQYPGRFYLKNSIPVIPRRASLFNYVLPTQLTMNDFSVHRIIGRGGFGEVYGCRKADTGKMYAMKCLDKKRIKMKQGETLALNERIMLSLVSTGVSGYRLSSFHPIVRLFFLSLFPYFHPGTRRKEKAVRDKNGKKSNTQTATTFISKYIISIFFSFCSGGLCYVLKLSLWEQLPRKWLADQ